ncbi:hypothetical protein HDU91_002292 [Kappamyces sp. JEL0680]|nr:hypothetical protein HDU91_002292 [Kappamyces sp. JEL0680]
MYPTDTDLLLEAQTFARKVSVEEESSTSIGTGSFANASQLSSVASGQSGGTDSIVSHPTDGFESRKNENHKRGPTLSAALQSGVNMVLRKFKPEPVPLGRTQRAGSIVYMGDPKRSSIVNTGFAFSQDRGMSELITPSQVSLEEVELHARNAPPGFSLGNMFGFSRPSTPNPLVDLPPSSAKAANAVITLQSPPPRPTSPIPPIATGAKRSPGVSKPVHDIDDSGNHVSSLGLSNPTGPSMTPSQSSMSGPVGRLAPIQTVSAAKSIGSAKQSAKDIETIQSTDGLDDKLGVSNINKF